MIAVDGYEVDYPDDNVSQKWRDWLPLHRDVEEDFVAEARAALRRRSTISGYTIVGLIRWKYKHRIQQDYGPMMARLAVAKHPELAPVFKFNSTGWGKRRKPPEQRLI